MADVERELKMIFLKRKKLLLKKKDYSYSINYPIDNLTK